MEAREGLSQLFDVEVEFVCDTPDLDLEALLWTAAVVYVEDADGGDGVGFHGIIEEAEYLHPRAQRSVYRLRLRPRIHGLAYRVRSRIFQQKDAVTVVKAVLKDAGIPDEALAWGGLAGRYPVREFCVQYQESELDFVLRLLEDEGIFYWFEHSTDGHVMTFGDSPASHALINGEVTLPHSRAELAGRDFVTDLVFSTRLRHDTHVARDWNFERPDGARKAEHAGASTAGFERFEYPGGFGDNVDGGRRAHNRLEEARVDGVDLEGRSSCRRLRPGRVFAVADVTPRLMAREYLLLEARHVYKEHGAGVGGATSPFRCDFRAVPNDTAFRPPRVTPRPRVHGKESAVVTGPGGEEIHVDQYGRIKVHFYWDREGKTDDNASCWIRVQQQNTSGSMILPRVGWEVDVGFIDGDPDRPVVLQKLYNQETMPPYGLPGAKTQSALQSSTSPGGAGTNEIRLEDGAGGMEFFIHASKDFAVVVGNNLGEDIAVDASEDVGLTLKSIVGARESVTIGARQSLSVTGGCVGQTGGSKTVSVGATDDWGVTGSYALTCNGARTDSISSMMSVLVAKEVSETFNGSCVRTVGAAFAISAVKGIAEAIAGSKTETVGGAKMEIIAKTRSETVGTSKVLTTGLMKVKTGADIGLAAKGALSINVGGNITEKCSQDFTFTAKLISVNAGAMTITVGGTELKASGGTLKLTGGTLGGKGGPELTLKGKVNFKP